MFLAARRHKKHKISYRRQRRQPRRKTVATLRLLRLLLLNIRMRLCLVGTLRHSVRTFNLA
jgi:hypothetical protein